jgi:hypothetical protein
MQCGSVVAMNVIAGRMREGREGIARERRSSIELARNEGDERVERVVVLRLVKDTS